MRRLAAASNIGLLCALAACDCGTGGAEPSDADRDAAADASSSGDATTSYVPRDAWVPDTGPEPCARGIRSVRADVPPLVSLYRQRLVRVAGEGETAFIAQTDFVDGQHVGRLTIVDARTGERRSFAQTPLPMSAESGRGGPAVSTPIPLAIRTGAVPEVLWASQAEEGPYAAVVRFAADAVEVEPIIARAGEWVYWAHTAAAVADGFLLLTEHSVVDPDRQYRLVHIAGGAAHETPLGFVVDMPTVSSDSSSAALSTAVGTTVFGALVTAVPEGQALFGLTIDLSGASARIESRELDRWERPGANVLTADAAGAGVVIGARLPGESPVRWYWLDSDLAELARWDAPVAGTPLGASGRDRQAIAFASGGLDIALHVGIADAPGIVRGGSRPLVNGLEITARGPPWESADGTISIAYLRGGIQILSLCGSP